MSTAVLGLVQDDSGVQAAQVGNCRAWAPGGARVLGTMTMMEQGSAAN